MSNFKLLINITFLFIAGAIACTKNTLNLPDPAQSLEGTYQGQVSSVPFPIKEGDITMTIKRVAKDTAEVTLQTIINGQIKDSITYKKAFIDQKIDRTSLNEGCINYLVYLTPSKETNLLRITCREKDTIRYTYTTTGQQSEILIQFKKM